MHCVLFSAFVLFILVGCAASKCSEFDFPCENGECVDAGLWCDSHVDCFDGSDEKYCKKSGLFNKDPNKCPSTYFKCENGPCIPEGGRCDGYANCEDSSDEKNCHNTESSVKSGITFLSSKAVTVPLETKTSTSTTLKTISNTTLSAEVTEGYLLTHSDSIEHSDHIMYSDVHPSDYSHQREKAREWLLSQRKNDFGWGDETSRAITALYLSDVEHLTRNSESVLLMVKQLEVQISLAMARNATIAVKLTDLALYINALLASCNDPKNFHGDNLVRILRNSVDAMQKLGKFINPSTYLTLCINNASTYEDARKLHDIFSNINSAQGRMDIKALAVLTSSCLHQNTNLLATSVYDGIKRQFLHDVNVSGIPGNVYEASIIFQALQDLRTSIPGLLEFILSQQQEDGSFGDVLSTYLVLPVLSGRSFLQMNEHCAQRYTTDPAPIEVLKNVKRRKIYIQYSLNYGNPPEITQTIQMKVAEGISFLDVMRLAQEVNPKYRFMLDGNRDIPVVYSIGGIPNDAEKGMFWTLHMASISRPVPKDSGRLAPYSGNIKKLIPQTGDEFVFWMKSI